MSGGAVKELRKLWKTCYKFWPSFWSCREHLCALQCTATALSHPHRPIHIASTLAFLASYTYLQYSPGHPHNTRLTAGVNIEELKFLYMCLISFLDYKQLLFVVISHCLCLVIQPMSSNVARVDGGVVWMSGGAVKELRKLWKTCYKFWPSFWSCREHLCALQCTATALSHPHRPIHIASTLAFLASYTYLQYSPGHPHNTRLTAGVNIEELKFLYMCLISFLDYKQLLFVFSLFSHS